MKGKQNEVAHRDNELGHPQSLCQLRMLPRLTTTLKAGLKLSLQKETGFPQAEAPLEERIESP